MTSIYYNSPLGSTSASTGTSDFLLVSTLSYHNSLAAYKDKYIPYYIEHTTLEEWEYGLGIVIDNGGGQDVLVRQGNALYPLATVYSSSNSNNKVTFSAGTKNVTTVISPERINHGGNNYSYQANNFTADTVQTTYGVLASGSGVSVGLPLASGNKNLVLSFKLLPNSDNNLTISPSGSDKIDGLSSTTLTVAEQYTSLISDGSGWYELVPLIDVTGVGLPVGSVGAIQFKNSSTLFDGSDQLFWESTSGTLLIGDSNASSASIILPSSGQNIIFNNQQYNSDFVVKGTGTNQLFFDASTGRLGINTGSPSTILHVVGRCANDTLKVESSTECPTGVALTLYHSPNTGSQTGDYPATINLAGRNASAQQINYAQIRSRILGTALGATSGELLFNVDHSGVSKNIASFNVGSINLGLNAQSIQSSNNIVIGQLAKDSGNNNILLGHYAAISGALSSQNIVLGNSTSTRGSNNIVVGHNTNISGIYVYNIGDSATVNSNYTFNLGQNNTIDGTSNFIIGSGNTVNSTDSYVLGNSNDTNDTKTFIIGENLISHNTSGYIVGFDNNISGLLNTINGNSIYVTGNSNTVLGQSNTIIGSNNDILGDINSITGSGNTVFGENISVNGSGCVIFGKDLSVSNNNSIIIGNGSNDLAISSGSLVYNSGTNNASFIVYGSAANTGLFYQNNLLGIDKIPSGYLLDINGYLRSTGIYTDNLRYGSSATSGSIMVSDSSGNASWQNISTVQQYLVNDLVDTALINKQSNSFGSTSGLYWSASSGLYLSIGGISSSFIVASTGNGPLIVNNNNLARTNVFNIKDSDNENLLLANSTNKRVGINITPSYNFHVSGVTRIQNSSLDYIDKSANVFKISYDESVSVLKNWQITSSGLLIKQTNEGSLIPIQSFSSSTPTDVTNVHMLVLEYNPALSTYQVKFTSGVYGGFSVFTGSIDDQ
jgi:hypothetical protein